MKKGEKAAEAATEKEPTMSLEIAADEYGEMMTGADMSAFTVDTSEGIKMLTGAREWRPMTDKAAGYFDASGETVKGPIKMRPLGVRKDLAFFGEVYGKEEMEVLQVLFVDQDNVVSSMVLMKSGAEEFKKMMDNISLKKKPLAMFEVTAEMEKKKTKGGFEYHLVTFKAELMEESKLKEVVAFVKEHPSVLKAYRDLPRKS